MDHMMPGMDGIEATRIIKNEIQTDYANNIPVVALTANALSGNEEMFLKNGFSAFVSKPIDIVRLDAILNQFVRDKQTSEVLHLAEEEKQQRALQKNSAAAVLKENPLSLEMLSIEGLDVKTGIERYSGSEVFEGILHSYITHTPELLQKLKNLSPETLGDYAITVHGLKSASYGIFAEEVGVQAAELEALSKAGNYDVVCERNDSFIQSTRILLGAIDEILASVFPHASSKESKAAIDEKILGKICDAAGRYKNALLEEAMSELERYSYEKESDTALVTWLREQVDNLEYDEICKKIKTAAPDKNSA